MTVEIVCQSPQDVALAEAGGAHRVELVSSLALGGLTPSIGLLEVCLERTSLPVMAMVRPRSGGFAYLADELDVMRRDADRLTAAGAKGLVFGCLTPAGEIDRSANARLAAQTSEAVFHRAFDVLPDPFEGLEILVDLGFRRILTSGGVPRAVDATERLQRLVERAAGRIEILVGGGVRPDNVAGLVRKTGTDQVHLGALAWAEDTSMARTNLAFNAKEHPETKYGQVDVQVVRKICAALREL